MPDAGWVGELVVERDVSGPMVGRAAVDTALGLRSWGVDSADWRGVATLHLQDGRAFEAPLRYQRARAWRLEDSTEWAAEQVSRSAERERNYTGMLVLPRNALQERAFRGDSTLVDSLKATWRETRDPDERAAVERLLVMAASRTEGRDSINQWLVRERLARGDSASVLADRLSGGSWLRSLTEAELDERIAYLDDIGRLWRIGVVPHWTYSTLATGLLDDSPILQPDTSNWNCTPAACERIASLLDTASEPRLRDVALVVAFGREPARWYERLQARADSGSLVVREALRMGDGVGATWPAAPGDPMPPPRAPWRTWLSWLGGTVRFQSSHANALRLYGARTGRDVVGELRERWPPEGDSATAVLGTILRHMGALPTPTLDELATELLSGSAARVKEARDQLFRSVPVDYGRPGFPDSLRAPPELRAEILLPLLGTLADQGRSPWPGIGPQGSVEASPDLDYLGGFHELRDVPLFLLDENLPEGFQPPAGSTYRLIDRERWDARPLREGGVLLKVTPLTAVGDYAAVAWNWTAYRRRADDEAPNGYAGGGAIWLLRTDEGWTVAGVQGWIT